MEFGFDCKWGSHKPQWLDGEQILGEGLRIGLMSGLALPSYRISGSMGPFLVMTLYITDRRVVTHSIMTGILTQQFSQWYPGAAPPGDDMELITSVRAGKNWCGEFLEVRSRSEHRPWYYFCSRNIRLRFYLPTAQTLAAQIQAHMNQ